MRRRRVLGDQERYKHHYYHVMSRVIEKRFIFGKGEKEYFYKVVEAYCDMTGIELITWTCMSNHFHLLVRVPNQKEREKLSDDAILDRLKHVMVNKEIYSGRGNTNTKRREFSLAMRLGEIGQMLKRLKRQDREGAYVAYREKLLKRMYDLPSFMSEIKQRFTQWYNRRNERKGPLWEERYKSVLLEGGSMDLVRLVAAYIDLNPVRAGLVKDPKDYRWSGYAEAVAKKGRCRRGLRSIAFGRSEGKEVSWKEAHRSYRKYLYEYGNGGEKQGEEGGELGLRERLGVRIRYLTEGLVLGSARFVEEVFEREKERQGWRRKRGSRQRKESCLKFWRTLVDLRGSRS